MEILTLKKDGITNFAKERNKLLEKAKGDWVLFLDSDEEVVGDRWPVNSGFLGYRIRRDNYFLGSFVCSEWLVRLGKKNAGKWVRRVHEFWDIKQLSYLASVIIKHDTAENLHEYITKINRYSTLHALANKEEGKKAGLLKIIFYSMAKFIFTLIKSRHIVFSIIQSLHSFLSWSKLYFLHS